MPLWPSKTFALGCWAHTGTRTRPRSSPARRPGSSAGRANWSWQPALHQRRPSPRKGDKTKCWTIPPGLWTYSSHFMENTKLKKMMRLLPLHRTRNFDVCVVCTHSCVYLHIYNDYFVKERETKWFWGFSFSLGPVFQQKNFSAGALMKSRNHTQHTLSWSHSNRWEASKKKDCTGQRIPTLSRPPGGGLGKTLLPLKPLQELKDPVQQQQHKRDGGHSLCGQDHDWEDAGDLREVWLMPKWYGRWGRDGCEDPLKLQCCTGWSGEKDSTSELLQSTLRLCY